MTRVEVVNRQEIDGKEYKRGEVIDVPDGRARDLITAGKARVPAEKAAPAQADVKAAATKGGK